MLKYIFCVLIFLTGCTSKKELGVRDYVKWVNNPNNGLRKSKEIGNLKVVLQYKPIDYVILSENRNKKLSLKDYKQRKNELKGTQFFQLSFSEQDSLEDVMKYDLNNASDYYNRMDYLSYDFQNHIKLIEGKDTLPCRVFNFVRGYGISPKAEFVLAFEDPDTSSRQLNDKLLSFDDLAWNTGTYNFIITKEDENDIPVPEIN